MSRLLLPLLCLLTNIFSVTNIYSQHTGVQFVNNLTWNQVKAKAKKERKYIFIDVYATWCGPCKAMDADVYTDKAIGRLLNAKFISVKIQQDQSKDDNEFVKSWYSDAKVLNKQYHIEALPSLLFLSPDGKLIHRTVGYKDTSELRKTVNFALTNPVAKLQQQLAAYKKGKRDSTFLVALVLQASAQEDKLNTSMVASDYIERVKDPFAKVNLEFIQQYTQKSTDPGFIVFYKNMEKVNNILGKNQAEGLVRKIISKEEIGPFLSNRSDNPDWAQLVNTVKEKYGPIGEEKVYGSQMMYYLDRKDWDNFGKAYEKYYETAIPHSEYHINNISWKVFEHVTDPQVLAVAVKATKYNLENYSKGDPFDMDTYANLLYKAGRKEEAIEIQKKAVQLSDNNKDLLTTLTKMQNGEPTWQ